MDIIKNLKQNKTYNSSKKFDKVFTGFDGIKSFYIYYHISFFLKFLLYKHLKTCKELHSLNTYLTTLLVPQILFIKSNTLVLNLDTSFGFKSWNYIFILVSLKPQLTMNETNPDI